MMRVRDRRRAAGRGASRLPHPENVGAEASGTISPKAICNLRRRRIGIDASDQMLHLVSCEDDSQGDAIQLAFATELQTQVLDPNDWSALLTRTFEEPQRLGAYLRSTEWRTATAADRKLFQAPLRAGIRLDSYQLLPLAKALELPHVNLLIADDVGLGKTVEAGLIVRELLLRRRDEMIVVAAPASMVLQWQDELAQNAASICSATTP